MLTLWGLCSENAFDVFLTLFLSWTWLVSFGYFGPVMNMVLRVFGFALSSVTWSWRRLNVCMVFDRLEAGLYGTVGFIEVYAGYVYAGFRACALCRLEAGFRVCNLLSLLVCCVGFLVCRLEVLWRQAWSKLEAGCCLLAWGSFEACFEVTGLRACVIFFFMFFCLLLTILICYIYLACLKL